MTDPLAYPLCWPSGLPRQAPEGGNPFRVSLASALTGLRDSLRLFGRDTGQEVTDVVISSNVTLGTSRPEDAGVAVYFRWDGAMRCIAVDRYDRPEANVRAIYMILEARRQEMRHGGLHIVRAAFKGFAALPAPSGGWRAVLGLGPEAGLAEAESAYRELARAHHPDVGGDADRMAEINAAIISARAELEAAA